jgi:hypothetical protein
MSFYILLFGRNKLEYCITVLVPYLFYDPVLRAVVSMANILVEKNVYCAVFMCVSAVNRIIRPSSAIAC